MCLDSSKADGNGQSSTTTTRRSIGRRPRGLDSSKVVASRRTRWPWASVRWGSARGWCSSSVSGCTGSGASARRSARPSCSWRSPAVSCAPDFIPPRLLCSCCMIAGRILVSPSRGVVYDFIMLLPSSHLAGVRGFVINDHMVVCHSFVCAFWLICANKKNFIIDMCWFDGIFLGTWRFF